MSKQKSSVLLRFKIAAIATAFGKEQHLTFVKRKLAATGVNRHTKIRKELRHYNRKKEIKTKLLSVGFKPMIS